MTNGTTYYYVVTATNSAGTSANSPEDSATPISPMVNVAFGGTASSSVIGGPAGEGPDQAFDRNSGSKWFNGNAANPGPTGWLRYDFGAGNAQTVKRYTVVSADVADRDPKTWTLPRLERRFDLDDARHAEQPGLRQLGIMQTATTSATPTAYRYYQLDVTANNGGAPRWRSPNSASCPTQAARSRTAPTEC